MKYPTALAQSWLETDKGFGKPEGGERKAAISLLALSENGWASRTIGHRLITTTLEESRLRGHA